MADLFESPPPFPGFVYTVDDDGFARISPETLEDFQVWMDNFLAWQDRWILYVNDTY